MKIELAEAYRGKRVAITGGLGFIGSNLARKLVQYGAEITLIDSLLPNYGGLLFNVEDIRSQLRINIADVRDRFCLPPLIEDQDILFNLAGQNSHLDSMRDPYTDLQINAEAQLHILEACRQVNPNIRVVFASTRQVYGRPAYLPVDEKHPLSPVDVNGVNKLAGEWYHLLYNKVYDVRSTCLRLTNTIGPRMRIADARQTFIGVWIRRILEGEVFEIWGGEQLRDFNFVDDVVEAFAVVAVTESCSGQIYNLGASDTISLRALGDLITSLGFGGSYEIKDFPLERRKIDIGDYYSDYSLINRELGWEPKTSLHDALLRTLQYYADCLPEYIKH